MVKADTNHRISRRERSFWRLADALPAPCMRSALAQLLQELHHDPQHFRGC
jgi:hypothetical protein